MAVGRRLLDGVEDTADLFLHEIAEAFAVTRARPDGGDDPFRRREPDVRRYQQLLDASMVST